LITSFLKFKRAMMQHTREGFLVSQSLFTLPHDTTNLDPNIKRALTICNLFVNHRLPIDHIASLLDEDRRAVIVGLINRSVIYDRRYRQGKPPQGKERRLAMLLRNRH